MHTSEGVYCKSHRLHHLSDYIGTKPGINPSSHNLNSIRAITGCTLPPGYMIHVLECCATYEYSKSIKSTKSVLNSSIPSKHTASLHNLDEPVSLHGIKQLNCLSLSVWSSCCSKITARSVNAYKSWGSRSRVVAPKMRFRWLLGTKRSVHTSSIR